MLQSQGQCLRTKSESYRISCDSSVNLVNKEVFLWLRFYSMVGKPLLGNGWADLHTSHGQPGLWAGSQACGLIHVGPWAQDGLGGPHQLQSAREQRGLLSPQRSFSQSSLDGSGWAEARVTPVYTAVEWLWRSCLFGTRKTLCFVQLCTSTYF